MNKLNEKQQDIKVWEEIIEIPTYLPGKPDKNPMFLEKRVYQGSSGRVYPFPVIDKIEESPCLQPYRILIMENEYLHIEIMPDIGGRIYRAIDKTNQYDFVYYNRVIKPALVGLAGPWISGGIEINWPQHHRPNTFGPVSYKIVVNEDGSQTVWVSEVDRLFGTKGLAGFTLYPGKAYLEIRGQLYNRTELPQTFLWWTNPALAVNEETQSIFPPDVHAVYDHGKRDISRFPIATGTYYKVDYSAGVDISRYRNIPVPTSYMAYHSDYDFVGGYDFGKQAGILHIANHHISPGKKQWTWGNGDFGEAWIRNLTDEDGPYIELMTGVFTDNQPDFSWLNPNEEKTFSQYFMPYKAIGAVKNSTIDAAVNFEYSTDREGAILQVYATARFPGVVITVMQGSEILFVKTINLSPTQPYQGFVDLPENFVWHALKVQVKSMEGVELVSYQPPSPNLEEFPISAKALPSPKELPNTEALYLAGLHLEQYRHATYEPDDYYLEGLQRDPGDIRLNNAYGTLLYRRGLLAFSEKHFRSAIATLTRHNPNPYDSESFYNLGRVLRMQDRYQEAFAVFYKSIWTSAFQDSGFLALAQIACASGRYEEALRLVDQSLHRHDRSLQARSLKVTLLRKLGCFEDSLAMIRDTLAIDPTDFSSHHLKVLLYSDIGDLDQVEAAKVELHRLLRGDIHNVLTMVEDYTLAGLYEEAIDILLYINSQKNDELYPMWGYALWFLYEKKGEPEKAYHFYFTGRTANPDYCFPNSLWELKILEHVLVSYPDDAMAHYYLGNWLYDKKRYEDAIAHWEEATRLQPDFPTAHRNLAIAYVNKRGDFAAAKVTLERAFRLNTNDGRVLYELDQLHKKIGQPHDIRLSFLRQYRHLVEQRDDLYIEFVTLHNLLEMHEEALEILLSRKLHPWEGGEGKTTGQYVLALMEIGKRYLRQNEYNDAISTLSRALSYPESLGEGKLHGAQENPIYFYLGCAYEGLGLYDQAKQCFTVASQGLDEPASAMFYNDQPPDTIFFQGLALQKMQQPEKARSKFHKLIDYGEMHLFDDIRIDYFAVSLPDFLVYEDDLNVRNQAHCHYMIGLGELGLKQNVRALESLKKVLLLDPNHQGAMLARSMI